LCEKVTDVTRIKRYDYEIINTTRVNTVPREIRKKGREQKYGDCWYVSQLVHIAHVFAAVTALT